MLDHPLVPGDTSAIEKGPWHYGADYVTVYFAGDRTKLQALVPPPFKVADGSGLAYVCEIVSVATGGAGIVADQPDRTLYQEAAIGVRCNFEDRTGVYFPVMWVTTEWSLLRGLLNGYQKRLADKISMSKLHPLNPGLGPIEPGISLSGFCVKGGERTLSVRVDIDRPGKKVDLPNLGATFGMRRYPRTDGSQASVHEAVEILKSNSRTADVWLGTGHLQSQLDLGKTEVTAGAAYRSGFTISGSRVLARLNDSS